MTKLTKLITKCDCFAERNTKATRRKHEECRWGHVDAISDHAFKHGMTNTQVIKELGPGWLKNRVIERLEDLQWNLKLEQARKLCKKLVADGYAEIDADRWREDEHTADCDDPYDCKCTCWTKVWWQNQRIDYFKDILASGVKGLFDEFGKIKVLQAEVKKLLAGAEKALKSTNKINQPNPDGTTWDEVLEKAGLAGDKFAIKVVADLARPEECHAGWLRDSVYALKDNIERGGEFGKAWKRGELETHRALGLTLRAYNRHNNTIYDSLVRDYGKEIARESI